MWFSRLTSGLLMVAASAFVLADTGCNKKVDQQAKAKIDPKNEKADGKSSAHEAWWCQEHGIPEDLCSICMTEANAKKKFKENGDWCKEHNRAESQCFKCDPKRYKKFEDMYVAKYGKKPERPPEEEFTR